MLEIWYTGEAPENENFFCPSGKKTIFPSENKIVTGNEILRECFSPCDSVSDAQPR